MSRATLRCHDRPRRPPLRRRCAVVRPHPARIAVLVLPRRRLTARARCPMPLPAWQHANLLLSALPLCAPSAVRSVLGLDPSAELLAGLGPQGRHLGPARVLQPRDRRGGAAGRGDQAAVGVLRALRRRRARGAGRHHRFDPRGRQPGVARRQTRRLRSRPTQAYAGALLGPDSAMSADAITVHGVSRLWRARAVLRARAGDGRRAVRGRASSNPEGAADSERAGRARAERGAHLCDEITRHNQSVCADGVGPVGAVVGLTARSRAKPRRACRAV